MRIEDDILTMTDRNSSRIAQYSPNDTSKANDRQVNRKNNVRFQPKATLEILAREKLPSHLNLEQKKDIVAKYLEVRAMLARLMAVILLVLIKVTTSE